MDQIHSQKPSYYDVFLSFRGEDTRKTFVSHLDKELCRRGFHIFKDDRKLNVGESLSEALPRANRKSSCAVVVISKNYADSSWCLKELQLIMELKENKEIEVIPIFYEVNPSDVRHQRGTFSLEMYQGPEMAKTVLEWRKALTGIADLKGMVSSIVSTEYDDDATMIEAIIRIISSRLLTLSPVDFDDFVGMEARMESLRPHLGMDSKDDVRFIGIFGMGGIGKTTIANYVYENHKRSFSYSYFIENVAAKVSGQDGLLELQRKILSHILREDNLNMESVQLGRKKLMSRLRTVDFFLVLDNVDSLDQLSALAEARWFGRGSRIIITTRDKSLLTSCGKFVYDVEHLNDDEARELLSKILTKGQHPPVRDYKHFSKEIIRHAKGIPLVLKALSTSLCGITEWEYALNSLDTVAYTNLGNILKSNYASLDEPGKTNILNIAGLWNGGPLWHVTNLLEGCENAVEVLAERSLIDMSADGRIVMHKLVKNSLESLDQMNTRGRILRKPAEINAILTDPEGKTRIEGVVLKDSVESLDFLEWRHFKPMNNLKFLMINQHLKGLDSRRHRNIKANDILPRNLKLLHWDAYPFTSLPSIMSQNDLVEVNLRYSKIRTLWSGTPGLPRLRKLDLTGSKDLKELPDLQEASSLEKLMLEGCSSLKKIPKSIRSLSRLQKLDVSNCDGLKNLRIIIGESNATLFQGTSLPVRSVRMDILDAEPSVKESPDISFTKLSVTGNLKIELKVLGGYAEHLHVNSEPQIPHQLIISEQQTDTLMSPPYSFKSLDIMRFDCSKKHGPFECHSFSGFPWLTELYLINLNIKKIPEDVHQMLVLEKLDLSGNDFSGLPSSMIHLLKLKHLTLCNCRRLEKLPELYQLETLTLSDCTNLRTLVNLSHADQNQGRYNLLELWLDNCKNVESLADQLSQFTKLTYLDISRHDLETVPTSIKDLSSLVTLCLSYCKKLKSLTELPLSLKYLYGHGCNSFEPSSIPIGHSFNHRDLSHCPHWHQDYSQITRFPFGKYSQEERVCVCAPEK